MMIFKIEDINQVLLISKTLVRENRINELILSDIHKNIALSRKIPISKNKIRCIIDLYTRYEWEKEDDLSSGSIRVKFEEEVGGLCERQLEGDL